MRKKRKERVCKKVKREKVGVKREKEEKKRVKWKESV